MGEPRRHVQHRAVLAAELGAHPFVGSERTDCVAVPPRYSEKHMKRTNLVLDEELLEELVRLSGERTYSAAVTRAIQEFVRRARAGRILELAGSGLWEGDLSEMRGDNPVESGDEDRRDGHAAG